MYRIKNSRKTLLTKFCSSPRFWMLRAANTNQRERISPPSSFPPTYIQISILTPLFLLQHHPSIDVRSVQFCEQRMTGDIVMNLKNLSRSVPLAEYLKYIVYRNKLSLCALQKRPRRMMMDCTFRLRAHRWACSRYFCNSGWYELLFLSWNRAFDHKNLNRTDM